MSMSIRFAWLIRIQRGSDPWRSIECYNLIKRDSSSIGMSHRQSMMTAWLITDFNQVLVSILFSHMSACAVTCRFKVRLRTSVLRGSCEGAWVIVVNGLGDLFANGLAWLFFSFFGVLSLFFSPILHAVYVSIVCVWARAFLFSFLEGEIISRLCLRQKQQFFSIYS